MNKEFQLKYIYFSFLFLVITGVVFFKFVEDLSWLDSLYFIIITLSTVGYGDISPKTDLGKLGTIFYVVLGVGLFIFVVNHFAERRIKRREERYTASSKNKE